MKRYLQVGFALLFTAAFGQSQEPDSLLTSLLARPDDTTKVILLNNYISSIRESNNTEALRVGEVAKTIAEKLNFRKALGPIFENIGWVLYRKGNYAKALIYGTEALKINREFGNRRGEASCTNNICGILFEQNRNEEAIRILKRAFLIAQELEDYAIMARCATNIALNFLSLHQLDSAQYYTELALAHGIRAKDPYRIAFCKRTLGDIFIEKKEYVQAQKNFFEALLPTDKGGNVFLEASTLYRIGKTYFTLKDYDKALQYLNRNKVISEKFEFKSELERTYSLLADIYRIKKDIPKVIYYQDRYLLVHDSLLIQRGNEQMALKLAKYEADIQQAQIDLLKKDALLKEEELKSNQVWNYISVAGLLILAIIGSALYYGNKRVKKINTELHDSNKKINVQSTQLSELNATKDKIFSIIGHDLRSPLASLRGLMDLVSGSNLTQEEFVHFSKKLKNNLDYVSDDLDNLLNWARAQSRSIDPQFEQCNPRSIVDELHHLYTETAQAKNVALENSIPEALEINADRNHLKLILRNLIGNSIKFSQGGSITATGHIHNDRAILSITDEGKGMSDEEVKNLFFIGTHFTKPGTNNEKGLGIGLLLVREFVEKNNGTISVKSELGRGSIFTISLQGHKVLAEVS
ncbi:MAG: tetratricopeptide repeat protein [Bacteroidetes bacterium]|nr:tetratricopeptide repeat protein [Bacteroidota bacterium]MBI3482395.1 tetratricopeptide repeat protein [Bacteroidota bacterium]